MNRNPFHEIRLQDFRCFHEQQTARLAPLTLLVGDNSTGKTTFLAALRAVWDVAFRQREPDFREPPYDLGTFPEIVHSRGKGNHRADSFAIGCSSRGRRRRAVEFDVTFESRAATPSPSELTWRSKDVWIKCSGVNSEILTIDLGSGNGSWRIAERSFLEETRPWLTPARFLTHSLQRRVTEFKDNPERLRKLVGTPSAPSPEDSAQFSDLLREFAAFPPAEAPFAGAPVRSSPRRTYDPTRPLPDPEGAYVPTYFANVHFQDKSRWHQLKEKLENFGRASGLFGEVGVRQLADTEGGPFQLVIGKSGTHRPGPKRNLIDVGYGVSQALPVLAELFRADASPLVLFQQPEVHLHPSAQAALGSLFCETAAAGRQLVVETHSDYIVDRVLLDVRDKRSDLKPRDVSILYFEREDLEVRIHSIHIDEEGRVLDAPKGYRRFFEDELNRVISY